jgi:hypothetical protein
MEKLPLGRHPGESRGPGNSQGLEIPVGARLDSGFRRNDRKMAQADFSELGHRVRMI